MLFKIPFTKLHVGTKESIAEKIAYGYGAYSNGGLFGHSVRISLDTLYTIYNNVVEVKQSVRRIQNDFAKEGYEMVLKSKPDINADDSASGKIVREVFQNPKMPFSIYSDLWIRDRMVAGNAYTHLEKQSLNGKVFRLNLVDPRTMKIVADSFGQKKAYIQSVMGKDVVMFEPNEILHSVYDFSTNNPVLGCSPIESVVYEAKTDMAAQKAGYYFYENNAVPSHLLIIDGKLTQDMADKLKKNINEQYKGVENRFKAGIIPFVKDIKTISPSQKEMQFLEHRRFNIEKISTAFGVDPFLLGYTKGVQRSNAHIIKKDFYENTVRPMEVLFEEMVNTELLPALGITDVIFKIKPSDYSDKQTIRIQNRADVQAGIMTINEAREGLGLDEHENEFADELLVNGQLVDDLGTDLETLGQNEDLEEKVDGLMEKVSNLLD